jgi:hypothetical protein
MSIPIIGWWWNFCIYTLCGGNLLLQIVIGFQLFWFGITMSVGILLAMFTKK